VKSKGELIDRDKGWRAMKKRVAQDAGTTVSVGVQGADADADHGGITMAQLAGVHEFGSNNIPERSFLRFTILANQKRYLELMRQLGNGILIGRFDVPTALGIFGEQVVSDVKARITSNIAPALAPSTIQRKGSTTALIDTGRLLNSITWTLSTVKSGAQAAAAKMRKTVHRERDAKGRFKKKS
jgi:hypothetical protein